MQFSISASEIMAEFWIILVSFGHFIDNTFKSERNPRIGYYLVMTNKSNKNIVNI
jgi:hypothetical protein